MQPVLISIVIPAYNEKKNIEACLRSLKAQDYTGPREIIVVDNNSFDNTAQLALQEGATVITEPQIGVIYAREAGTRLVQGQIIIQTEADTTFPSNWLSRIIETFSAHQEAVAVIGSFRFADGPWWGKPFTTLLFGITNLIYKINGRLIYIPGANTAFKKQAWHGYDIKLDQGGDEVALLKSLKKEGQIIFLRHNTVLTSARRLKKGLLYNIFVILIFYYIFDYTFRRVTGRSILKPFPKVRDEDRELKQA